MKKSRLLGAVCAVLFSYITVSANAAPITFNLEYSGASFGNTAVATGSITFDDALLPNPSLFIQENLPSPLVLGLTLTVSGATSGNGTFGLPDFDFMFWDTEGATLDFSQELVGQPTAGGPWGTQGGFAGDFNLFASNLAAPNGTAPFVLTTDFGVDDMLLTSMSAVPVPAATWLFGSGLLGLIGIARRKAA